MSAADSNAASLRATISRKKLAANRRNARKSTGPRTEQGKRASAMNACSHGLFCRELILPGEDRRELISLWNGVQNTIQAQNALELALLSRFVQAQWKLLRVQAADAALHRAAEQGMKDTALMQLRNLRREQERLKHFLHADPEKAAENKTLRLRTQGLIDDATAGKLPAGLMLAASMVKSDDASSAARERLNRYEQRIEGGGMRALSLLLKLREQMRKQPGLDAPVRFLIDENEIADDQAEAMGETQNEPTEEKSVPSDAAADGCEAAPVYSVVLPAAESTEIGAERAPMPPHPVEDAPLERSD